MNKPVKSRWPRIWRVINSWLVALNPDRWEAMYSRMRRLEGALLTRKARRPGSAQSALQRRIVLRHASRERNLDKRLSR